MKEFTLQEKIGQLVSVGFHGTLSSDPQVEKLREQIKAGQVGGVLFYRYNIENPQQIKNLIGELNNAESKAPLFIMLHGIFHGLAYFWRYVM
jgi:beta-N-acetylhexosaminidase